MENFLSNDPPRFDAVFAGDDDLAVSVISALQNAGLNVPRDVAVVGFDDQRFASLLVPALTTIHAPTEEVGECAGKAAFKITASASLVDAGDRTADKCHYSAIMWLSYLALNKRD